MSDFPLNRECFVTPLALTAIKKFGPESLEWEPEILRDAFEETFEMNKMPQKMFDKLNCGYMLIGTDAFSSTIEGFLSATAIMNNLVFSEDEAPYCSLEMCAWSIWEYINLMGDIKDGKPTIEFCPDIIKYIQEVGRTNGISKFPPWMEFANPEDASMPDMTGDADLFEMYNQRQSNYISDLNGFVTEKQKLLTEELLTLQKDGILG
jgi:hypothetical protein